MCKKLKVFICAVLGIFLVSLGVFCLFTSTRSNGFPTKRAALAAAALALPDGGYRLAQVYGNDSTEPDPSSSEYSTEEVTSPELLTTATIDETVFSEDSSLYADEVQLPVVETQYSDGDLGFNNFFVKNTTGFSLDIEKYLNRPLDCQIEKTKDVQVLIVHTHTCESYLTYDEGYYHESFYPRSENPQRNMLRVGRAIVEGLEAQGIGAVQATEIHDSPAYDGAYYRSYDTITKQYP